MILGETVCRSSDTTGKAIPKNLLLTITEAILHHPISLFTPGSRPGPRPLSIKVLWDPGIGQGFDVSLLCLGTNLDLSDQEPAVASLSGLDGINLPKRRNELHNPQTHCRISCICIPPLQWVRFLSRALFIASARLITRRD